MQHDCAIMTVSSKNYLLYNTNVTLKDLLDQQMTMERENEELLENYSDFEEKQIVRK
jgi:hypothetical protein